MKTNIRTLRKIADRLGFSVYRLNNWVLSDRETENLHHSVTNEREALMVGLIRASERDMLTKEEVSLVRDSQRR